MKKLLFIIMLISGCNMYDEDLLIELRYTIKVEHCAQNGFDVIPVIIQKKQGDPMIFEVKNCKLFAIINETDTLLLHDHCYRYWIIGGESPNMGAVK